MKKLAIVFAKGGVGKTTTAVNLAAALAGMEKRVLLVDADGQASATHYLGLHADDQGTAALMLSDARLKECITETNVEGLDLVPGSPALVAVDISLSKKRGREKVLANKLKGHRSYDFLIIDSPPAQTLMCVNALVASNHFILPVTPSYLALAGILDTLDFVEEIHEGIGKCAELLGILLTMVDGRKKGHQEYIKGVKKSYRGKVLRAQIGTNAPLEVSPSHGKTIFQYSASSTGAKAYLQLAREVVRKTK